MVYKNKLEILLETLESKLKTLHSVAQGTMRLSTNDILFIIEDCQRIRAQVAELISLER